VDKFTSRLPFTPWNEKRSQFNMTLCWPQILSAGYFEGVKIPLSLAENQTPDRPAHGPVTTPITLPVPVRSVSV
jgi:hypothetical protein